MEKLYFNSVLFITFLIFLFLYKKSAISKLMTGLWTISSIAGIIYASFFSFESIDISINSIVYLDICLLIYIFPLINNCQNSSFKVDDKITKNIEIILLFIGLLSIVPFVEHSIQFVTNFSNPTSSIVDTYYDKLDKDIVTWLDPVSYQIDKFLGRFNFVLPFLLFVLFTKRLKIKTSKLIIFLIAVFMPVVKSLNASGRGGLAAFLIEIVILYFLFKKYMIIKFSKKFIAILGAFIFIAFSAMMTITTLRFKDVEKFDENYSMALYLGEGSVNFSNWMWDIKQHTRGDNSFSYIKDKMGMETFTNYVERRKYWNESKTGVQPHRFYTFIGDWYSDLGKITTLLFISILALLVRSYLSKKRYNIMGLYLIYTYCYIFSLGFTYYQFKTTHGTFINGIFMIIVLNLIDFSPYHRHNLINPNVQ